MKWPGEEEWAAPVITIQISYLHEHVCPAGCATERPSHVWKHALPRCPHPYEYICPVRYVAEERRSHRKNAQKRQVRPVDKRHVERDRRLRLLGSGWVGMWEVAYRWGMKYVGAYAYVKRHPELFDIRQPENTPPTGGFYPIDVRVKR